MGGGGREGDHMRTTKQRRGGGVGNSFVLPVFPFIQRGVLACGCCLMVESMLRLVVC
jgi:hypothetical protein